MITILHTESSRQWGGQEQRILLEAIGMQTRGYRLIIACRPDSRTLPRAKDKGITTRIVDMKSTFSFKAFLNLITLIHREKVDIVNTHSSKDSWLASLAVRLFFPRVKVIRTRHVSIPIASHPLNFVYRLPHKIISCGEVMAKSIMRDTRLPAEKIVSIPTGVDLTRFNFSTSGKEIRQEWGVEDNISLVGTIGIIRSEKGHVYFVEAAKRILETKPETRFVIVGNEPKGDTISRKIKDLDLQDKIIMAGLREDIPQVLAAMDMFILPSLREGVPQGIVQALAMKKPVIASAVGGILELIEDNFTGLLVSPADSKSLSNSILELLNDKDKAKSLGEAGYQLVKEKFSLEIMLDKTVSLYEELLKKCPEKEKNT